jgi:hypothetical protein
MTVYRCQVCSHREAIPVVPRSPAGKPEPVTLGPALAPLRVEKTGLARSRTQANGLMRNLQEKHPL